eukprot:Skav220721  [mRNA]  locus=scaffold2753:43884:54435:- [translate_table: standard]
MTWLRNQSFLIVEDAQLPENRGWDGICGLGWKGIAQLERPLYRNLQEMGRKDCGTGHFFVRARRGFFSASGARAGAPLRGEAWHVGLDRCRVDAWRPATGKKLLDRSRRHCCAQTNTSFNQLCGMDEMAGAVFCDCSIVEHSKHLPPLRIFFANRPFELPIGEMFSRVPTKDGSGEACLLAVQPNNLDVDVLPGSMPMPLPFGGLGGPRGLLPDLSKGFPFDLPDLLGDLSGSMGGSGGSLGSALPSFGGMSGSGGSAGLPGFGGETKEVKSLFGDLSHSPWALQPHWQAWLWREVGTGKEECHKPGADTGGILEIPGEPMGEPETADSNAPETWTGLKQRPDRLGVPLGQVMVGVLGE